jgi:hypothetical protein
MYLLIMRFGKSDDMILSAYHNLSTDGAYSLTAFDHEGFSTYF